MIAPGEDLRALGPALRAPASGSAAEHPGADLDPEPGVEQTPPAAGPPPETRRERLRRETVEEIKAAARSHLTLEATSQLSLRAVARDVGLTPSAIYRYFQSQQELMAAVADDAYASAAGALRASAAESAGMSPPQRLRRLGHAYRRWAHDHKAEFNLIFSTDQPGSRDGATASSERVEEFFAVPVMVFVEASRTGQIDLGRALIPRAPELTPAAARFASLPGIDLSPEGLNLLLCGWGAFHGFVMLELFGHLGRFYTDPGEAFDRHLLAILAAMGMSPDG